MHKDDGYISYIINPKAGASSGKHMVAKFNDYLRKKGYDVRTGFTISLDHAREMAENAGRSEDCQMVAVAGGDGTVRDVIHGLEGSGKPLMVIPCGTENLLANELGYDVKTKTLIKAFEGGETRVLDLGCANAQHFTSIAGLGFDAEVVHRVNIDRSGHINHLDYFWPIWRTFWEHKYPEFKVVVDGEDVFEGRGLIFVGNISRYAVGLELLHYANYSDGLLDICVYKCNSRLHLAKHSVTSILKIHSDMSDVVYRQGKVIEVSSSDEIVYSELDGDPGPNLPVKIEVIPQAVNVIVPPGAKPAGIRTRLLRIIG